jgi:hypothetical protein
MRDWGELRRKFFASPDAFYQPHTEIGFFLSGATDAAAKNLTAALSPLPWTHKEIRDWYFPIADPRLQSFRLRQERTAAGLTWIAIASLASRRYERIAVRLHADRDLAGEPLAALTTWLGSESDLTVDKTRVLSFLEPFGTRRGGCVKTAYASMALDRIHRIERSRRPVDLDSPVVMEFEYGGTARPLALKAIADFTAWTQAHTIAVAPKLRRKYASVVVWAQR